MEILQNSNVVNDYVAIAGCPAGTVTGVAIAGVAAVPSPLVPSTYPPPTSFANGKHIVRALMYTSLTGLTSNPYTGYSLPYDTGLKASI